MLQGSYSAGRKGTGKLAIGKYPYTYARVSVMRSFLLRKEDYNKLMKMNVNEIIGYLESSQYKREIDELAVQFKGVQLMELALNKNLVNIWNKLKRISPPSLRTVIAMYLLRVDVWNIKNIIRASYTRLGHEQLKPMLLPSGFLGEKNLAELAKKESVEEILKSLGVISYDYLEEAVKRFEGTNSLAEIENLLDKFYYSVMREFSKRLPNEGRLFRQFLESELEVATMMNVLRLKRANTTAKEIERYVTMPGFGKLLIRKMINAANAEEAAKLLEHTKLKSFAEAGVNEFLNNGSLIRLETDLYKQLLKHSVLLIHKHPLTVDVILGYMFAKEVEVKNLKLILKAKQLGLSEEFVEGQIVTM